MTQTKKTVAIVQFQPQKGPPEANLPQLEAIFAQLAEAPPALIVLPEAALTGYFLEGATFECARSKYDFAQALSLAWRKNSAADVEIVCGFYESEAGTLYNSAIAIAVHGATFDILHVHRKVFLPTYGVFDEARFVARGRAVQTYSGFGGQTGLAICEDVWHALMPSILALKGMQMLIIPSASPARGVGGAEIDSVGHWHDLLRLIAGEHGVFICYAGLVGFEGGKAMSGGSCLVDPFGCIVAQVPTLVPAILRAEIDLEEGAIARAALPLLGDLREIAPDLLADPELAMVLHGSLTPGAR
jgi:predicted amidohydrolase